METLGKRQIWTPNYKKMADNRFALSNQNIIEKLKENAKNKNTLKATQTWSNVWQTWATQWKVNPKMEEYEHEKLDKSNFVENIINKKTYEPARAFRDLWSLVMFWKFSNCSCNFENFQNITRAHKSRNALVFIRFPILILKTCIL